MEKTIFVVDDNDTNLQAAKQAIKDDYRVLTMPSAAKMFEMIFEKDVIPDMILLDIEMPEMDGFEALTKLKEDQKSYNIPVIFLTSVNSASVEAKGFEMGVIDFITKPFSAPVLQNRIKTHLDIDGLIRERTKQLEQKTEQLQNLQSSTVFVVADMVESRDKETGGHVERTTVYVKIFVEAMIRMGVYADQIKDIDMEAFVSSARLHDVGKITISDAILNKPAKLTPAEYEEMKTHAKEGEKIIEKIEKRTENEDFLHNAKLFAGYHHERWDGKGYPYGLRGTAIPLQGRIMAIVDIYDALVSHRPFKRAFTAETANKIIIESSGVLFDPELINVFEEVKDEFKSVKTKIN